jgi:enamine deaminase RidA (YjgF/YER057c/UK114 family)
MHPIEQKLKDLGLTLPPPPKPVAAYIPCVRVGDLVYVSGQLPMKDGQLLATGPVPSQVAVEAAQAAARQCALNALAIVLGELGGDWSRLVRVVRLGVFVQSDDGFAQQPQVANGASDLLRQLLGDPGRAARAAVGTNSLPLNASVEVEMIAQIR